MARPRPRRWPKAWRCRLAGGPIAFTAAELIEACPAAPGCGCSRRMRSPHPATPILPRCSARITAPAAALRRRSRLDRPVLMGIVNVTPDCFSDGGLLRHEGRRRSFMPPSSPRRAPTSSMSAANRPGRAPTRWTRAEELARVVPVIAGLRRAPRRDLDRYAQSLGGARRRQGTAPKSSTTCRRSPMIPTACRPRPRPGLAVVLMHAQGRAQDHAGQSAL